MKALLRAALCAAALAGCVSHQGSAAYYVEQQPPHPRGHAGESRPGYVWIEGNWMRDGGQWDWVQGRWEAEQPGYVWVQGRWQREGQGWRWRPGRWEARAEHPTVHAGAEKSP